MCVCTFVFLFQIKAKLIVVDDDVDVDVDDVNAGTDDAVVDFTFECMQISNGSGGNSISSNSSLLLPLLL